MFRPFFLGGLYRSIGNQPPATLLPRGRYLLTDLRRWAAYYGIPFRMASPFPTRTLTAQRALIAMPPDELMPAAREWAGQMAQVAPLALQSIKEVLRAIECEPTEKAFHKH